MGIVHCQVWSPFKWCNRGYTNDKQLPSTGGEAQEKETWCDFLSTHYPEFLLFFVVFSLSRSHTGEECSDPVYVNKVPVVPHKAVAEVSKIGNL